MTRLPIYPALLVAFSLVAQTAPKPDAPKLEMPKADVPKAANTQVDASHLTLQDAIEASLRNNLQVQISAETRETVRAGVPINAGVFDWQLTSGLVIQHAKSSVDGKTFDIYGDPFFGTATADNRSWTVGLAKPTEWGGTLQLNYNPIYSYYNQNMQSRATPPNPAINITEVASYPYSGTFNASFTQSLLRNFGRDATAANLIVARYGSKAADYNFQLAIINQVASTESAYWAVVFAKLDLENKRVALALAQQQLKEDTTRVQVGTLAPLGLLQDDASVAQAEQDIITSEANLANAKDALIRTIYPIPDRPATLDTADLPTVKPMEMDEAAAEKMALADRVELKGADLDLLSKRALETAANNRILPQLDLNVAYNGSTNNYTTFSPVNSDLAQGKNPGYTVGLQFSLPIMNQTARGNQALARANRRSSELSRHDLELGIILQVRTAYRNLDSLAKGVVAAEKTRVFREQNLDAEHKKLENGMSTSFLVLTALNDLNTSKGNELQARINYANAVTAFDQAVGRLLQARHLEVK
jgi:outer membrane protein TolC